MGEVYRARDSNLNRDVAITVFLAIFASDADAYLTSLAELKCVPCLSTPALPPITPYKAWPVHENRI
jgi:hypothetical protein